MPDFTPENAKKCSAAAAGLCLWVRSICQYHNAAKEAPAQADPEPVQEAPKQAEPEPVVEKQPEPVQAAPAE